MVGLTDLTDGALRVVEDMRDGVEELFFEPTLRLGVTGLAGAGKTVFITSLVANLLQRGRMRMFTPEAEGRIEAAMLRPQPDRDVPRFDYEAHLSDLTGEVPRWPQSTRRISQLRLSLRYRSGGWIGGLTGPNVLHLDIVDYPGEWLLDLPLMRWSYAEWARRSLEDARYPARAAHSEAWRALLDRIDPAAEFDEAQAREAAETFTAYLGACRKAGLSGLAPGRFLMPGDLEGSPALTFAPLKPAEFATGRGSLWAEMERRYEAYKRAVVTPFFRNHFARIDRQVVLVDALSALHAGPGAVADMRRAMSEILDCFKPGENSWLSSLLGKRVERILFAATKADHIHHTQHARLSKVMDALLRESVERASYKGAKVQTLSLAALRATVEAEVKGQPMVRGRLLPNGRMAALHPGDLPPDPGAVIAGARRADETGGGWLEGDYGVMNFAPPILEPREGEGPPHIRLDRAAEFLLADRLR